MFEIRKLHKIRCFTNGGILDTFNERWDNKRKFRSLRRRLWRANPWSKAINIDENFTERRKEVCDDRKSARNAWLRGSQSSSPGIHPRPANYTNFLDREEHSRLKIDFDLHRGYSVLFVQNFRFE